MPAGTLIMTNVSIDNQIYNTSSIETQKIPIDFLEENNIIMNTEQDNPKKYKKMKYKYKKIQSTLKHIHKYQIDDIWYRSKIFNDLIPVISNSIEYTYAHNLVKQYFPIKPNLILKKKKKKMIEYNYYIEGTIPFKLKVPKKYEINEIPVLKLDAPKLLFAYNLLKKSVNK